MLSSRNGEDGDEEPHDELPDDQHDRRVLESVGDLALLEDAGHDPVPDRVGDDRHEEGEEQLRDEREGEREPALARERGVRDAGRPR